MAPTRPPSVVRQIDDQRTWRRLPQGALALMLGCTLAGTKLRRHRRRRRRRPVAGLLLHCRRRARQLHLSPLAAGTVGSAAWASGAAGTAGAALALGRARHSISLAPAPKLLGANLLLRIHH